MITRRKVRRVALWIGVGIGALALVALVVSAVRPIGHQFAGGGRSLILARGSINFYWQPSVFSTGLSVYQNGDAGVVPGWWRWLPKWIEPEPSSTSGFGHVGEFVMPLWIPAAFGLLCLYSLLPERGPRSVCDKCSYDLRAVPAVNGRTTCPECGTIAEP
jgi:hypothetical protein